MKKIPLTNGMETIVDDDDFEKYNDCSWYPVKSGQHYYAATGVYFGKTKASLMLHRLIIGAVKNKVVVDHINGNTLDNRKVNLRKTSQANNNKNKFHGWSSSKYKGVSFHKSSNKWQARIGENHKSICIGFYKTPIQAALAYDNEAKQRHIEFANLNFKTPIQKLTAIFKSLIFK